MSREGLQGRTRARNKPQMRHVQAPAGVTAEISNIMARPMSYKATSCILRM